MPPIGAEFKRLHDLRIQLKEVQEQLARGPRQIKLRQGRVSEAEERLATSEREVKEAKTTADRKNLDLRTKETHLADLQGKLNAAASNREYDIIRGQMEADRAAKAVLEDEILEWLERIDARQRDVAEAKKAVQDAQEDVRKFADEFEQRAAELHKQEAELKAKIDEAESIIPSELRVQYQRLVAAHGADSLASAENGVCNQCFVSLTPQSRVLLNSGKLMFCSTCGRLLYPAEK